MFCCSYFNNTGDVMSSHALCFDDVLLRPRYSDIESRSEIDLSVSVSNTDSKLSVPIISSPMDTVTEENMALGIYSAGGLGIIHRYNDVKTQSSLVESAVKSIPDALVGAAIGVSGGYIERAQALVRAGARVICVDIAHGHHMMMRHTLRVLRNTFGTSIHIMAGNVATREGFDDLAAWGADSVRVGIGGGSICSTRIKTGHGAPTLQSVIDCASSEHAGSVLIVADGGIRTSGDIVKALAGGADVVMLGSLLAGTKEAPGEVIYKNGLMHKAYRGMASAEAQIDWRGHTASLEGVSTILSCKGNVAEVVDDLVRGIRSGLSYSGAKSISDLQSKSDFIEVSHSSIDESSTHIFNS
jgi:IMP dehydrogenase